MCVYIKNKVLSKQLTLFWYANSLVVGPQLNNIFGHYGIPSKNICTEFNGKTKGLPEFFLLKVKIDIISNRVFNFSFALPNFSFFIRSCSFELYEDKVVNGRWAKVLVDVVLLSDVLKICKLKGLPFTDESIFKSVFFTIRSMDVKIVYDKK